MENKCLIHYGSLSVKYVILNRIGAASWEPTNHSSGITYALAKLIFLIWTKSNLNFGEYVFDQTMNHVDPSVVKLPIYFPCLITGIILNQHPNIKHAEEIKNKKEVPLTLDYMLSVGTHVPYIVVSKRTKISMLVETLHLDLKPRRRMYCLNLRKSHNPLKKLSDQAP